MNDIWNEAPEGATHYQPQQQAFYADMGGEKWMIWARNLSGLLCWQPSTGTVRDCLIPTPSEATWTGEGLPPVGAVCEALWDSEDPIEYKRIVVVGHDEGMCVFRWAEGPCKGKYHAGKPGAHYDDPLFRPIRTPEQIAAEERKEAIEEMWKVYWNPDVPTAKEALGLLYDAGYRKVTP